MAAPIEDFNLESAKKVYDQICENLNIDEDLKETSWNAYKNANKYYKLRGSQQHWLCCSLFIECAKKAESSLSITQICNMCDISTYWFFKKTKLWMDMVNVPENLWSKIENLEKKFCNELDLYREFVAIFENVKNTPCSLSTLYQFTWYLFVLTMANYGGECDLFTAFHMLLCSCDLIYMNLFKRNKNNLKKTKSKVRGTKKTFDSSTPYCIMEYLCQSRGGTLDQFESISWKALIEKMFDNKTLRGDPITFRNLITRKNFQYNFESLKRNYDLYIESCEPEMQVFLKQIHLDNKDEIPKVTKLSHIDGRDSVSTLAITLENVKKLCSDFKHTQSELLKNNLELSKQLLCSMSSVFKNNVLATNRWHLVEKLYFHLLSNILKSEITMRSQEEAELLLKKDQFLRTLIVCCVEIVVYSFNPQQSFCTVLQWYKMYSINFYRIIELVVLEHKGVLTRDIVKHLKKIEEHILDSFAWKSCSPLWDRIGCQIPRQQDVVNPNTRPKSYDITNITLGSSTKKTSPLDLFFRKFYNIAFNRMRKLCDELKLTNEDLQTTWTIFEHCIVEHTYIMQDRTLDQMILCTLFVLFKARYNKERKVIEIMQLYIYQPYYSRQTYRKVLIGKCNREENYGDLKKFYNTVYFKKMGLFIFKFAKRYFQESLLLSPLPSQSMGSPREPLRINCLFRVSTSIKYKFPETPVCDDSPSNDRVEINGILSQSSSAKHLSFTDEASTSGEFQVRKSTVSTKVEQLYRDRMAQQKH